MKTYTATQLKNRTGDVLHDAQMDGAIKIKNRSRPNMVLMTEEKFEKLCLSLEAKNINKEYSEIIDEVKQ